MTVLVRHYHFHSYILHEKTIVKNAIGAMNGLYDSLTTGTVDTVVVMCDAHILLVSGTVISGTAYTTSSMSVESSHNVIFRL